MLFSFLAKGNDCLLKARLQSRLPTWRQRALPDFIIAGAQKAGTTSLYTYLAQHPEILPSLVKEVHYFDGGLNPGTDNYLKGERWYRSHFPLKARRGGRFKTGEASPLYLFNPLAPHYISDLLPGVKLIVLLRNPVGRAISHYHQEKRRGQETLPILEAFEAEEARLAPVLARRDYKSDVFINCSYKKRGMYHEQLHRYYQRFPREQVCVMSDEEFFGDIRQSLRRLFEFIGVDRDFQIGDLEARNVGARQPKPAPEVYEHLRAFFLPHNEALYALIGRRFSW